ncbi:caspase family protein [Nocardia jejuensis]|uniref:caspase family protein n=1 Tax=Nocardia jejuensis TaxID=328049 RepID=UPI0009FC354C|nr:caspase family protein [Nocardia jejuensis]
MPQEYRALLIGVHSYAADSGFSPLKGPPNDLRELRRVLEDRELGLFTVTELLDPTSGKLGVAVQKFLSTATADDHLLLYYSGHGETSVGNKQLCLTSIESDMAALDGGSLSFDKCYEWIKDSPARSVIVILDCCRSGVAFKGSTPDFEEFDALFADARQPEHLPRPKSVKVLSAGTGYQNALDAPSADEPSPFSARLITALRGIAGAQDEGLVSFDDVVIAMRPPDGEPGPRPRAWGTDGDDGPYLAQRPGHIAHTLARNGLKEVDFDRTGAAIRNGKTVHVRLPQVEELVGRFTAGHPTTMFVSGPVGSGKTWILNDTAELLVASNWRFHAFVPSCEPEDAHKLLGAFRRRAEQLAANDDQPCLLVVDGLEWSDAWAEFISGLQDMAERGGFGVSVLASLEIQRGQVQRDHEHKSWMVGGNRNVQSVVGHSAKEFVAEVLTPAHNPNTLGWPEDRLNRARTNLLEVVGSDLWALTQLGSRWHDPDAEEQVIRSVWEDRIGDVTGVQLTALHKVAALSRFNLWCPLDEVVSISEILIGLGLEYSEKNQMVRLNSGFLCRAILARQAGFSEISFRFSPGAAYPVALNVVTKYLRALLLSPHRQADVLITLNRLRYNRRVFNAILEEFSRSSRARPSTWDIWADDWADSESVTRILSFVHTTLPSAQSGELGVRFCRFLLRDDLCDIRLPTAVSALDLLRNLHRGRNRPAGLAQAESRLMAIAEQQLAEHRWPAATRRRLLRVLRQMRRIDRKNIDHWGSLLLRPSNPPVLADLTLALDLFKINAQTIDTLQGASAAHDVAADDLVRGSFPDTGRLEQLAVRCILARKISDEDSALRLEQQIKNELRLANTAQLNQMLSRCVRLDRRFTAEIVGLIDVDTWSTTIYRNASPIAVANLLRSLGSIRPDLAVRTLYTRTGCADNILASSLATAIRPDGDAVSASMLLKSAADCEEHRGILDGGFAQTLAYALGTDFLADTMAHNTQTSIVVHLIEGFVRSRTALLESVKDSAFEIIEDQLERSGSENGARLALILSVEDALGEAFLTELRTRGLISRDRVLLRMLNVRNPGALVAYHELGVALFPGIEADFANEVEESGTTWTDSRLFDDLSGEGNVVLALRAAKAVTSTLVLSGRHDAGEVIIGAFQRAFDTTRPGHDWSRRVLDADDIDLPEGLRLLNELSSTDAKRITESHTLRLSQAARRGSSTDLADLISATTEISQVAGGRLVDTCRETELLRDALEDLEVSGDLFAQAAALSDLADAENRLCAPVIPTEIADRLRHTWSQQIQVINNPGLIQTLIRIVGNSGRANAITIAHEINLYSLRRRLDRYNVADAAGFISLIGILSELVPDVLPDLASTSHARWLLARAPIDTVARSAESMVATGLLTSADVENVLSIRLNVTPDQVPMRHRGRYWHGIGWAAWTSARLGKRLRLGIPPDARFIDAMVPHQKLWALSSFETEPWMEPMMDNAFDTLEKRDGPPDSPAAAAAALIAYNVAGREVPLYGEKTLTGWRHALDAESQWIRALAEAAKPSGRLHKAFGEEWMPWDFQRLQARLVWQAHGWRKVPVEALAAITEINRRNKTRSAAKGPKPRQSSGWQRTE